MSLVRWTRHTGQSLPCTGPWFTEEQRELASDLQSAWMGPWEASYNPWALWNAQGPKKRSFFSLYKIGSGRAFRVPPGPILLMGQFHQDWVQLSLALRKPSVSGEMKVSLYADTFAKCSPIIAPLLLIVKEESFGHHLRLVKCMG